MQVAVNRVMQTYGMLVDLSLEEERDARDSVSAFLAQSKATDEQALVVEGLRFLRARSHAHR